MDKCVTKEVEPLADERSHNPNGDGVKGYLSSAKLEYWGEICTGMYTSRLSILEELTAPDDS